MRVLVTGAAGMLGSAARPALREAGHEVFATDIDTGDADVGYLDVREAKEVRAYAEKVQPDIIMHLAAETDVDLCENDIPHAFRTNTVGTQNVAYVCKDLDVPMVYISTAGVFDGKKEGLYHEYDPAIPVIVYGRSKLEGTEFVRSFLDKYYVIRAGWMIGGGPEKDKKFVNKIIKQIQGGATELFAVTDKFGTPTYTKDFVRCLLNLVATNYYGLYHMVCSGTGTRYDVACHILEVIGRQDIPIHQVGSDHFKEEYPAPRPRSEMMQNLALEMRGLNLMRPWKVALREYIEDYYPDFVAEQRAIGESKR